MTTAGSSRLSSSQDGGSRNSPITRGSSLSDTEKVCRRTSMWIWLLSARANNTAIETVAMIGSADGCRSGASRRSVRPAAASRQPNGGSHVSGRENRIPETWLRVRSFPRPSTGAPMSAPPLGAGASVE